MGSDVEPFGEDMDPEHIVAIGAHAGDMELTAGGVVAKYTAEGHRATFVHMTPGEKGHPSLSAEAYRRQKIREAEEVAERLGAEVRFLPYRDAELPVAQEVKWAICDLVRELKPTVVITHWKESIHPDHTNCHLNVVDGLFYGALREIRRSLPAHPVARLFFAENWEDPEDFEPYIYVEVPETAYVRWAVAVERYAFVRGETSSFPYMEYYRALAVIRGAESGFRYAETFMVPKERMRQRMVILP